MLSKAIGIFLRDTISEARNSHGFRMITGLNYYNPYNCISEICLRLTILKALIFRRINLNKSLGNLKTTEVLMLKHLFNASKNLGEMGKFFIQWWV